jgi:hypothetical protein
MVSVTSSPRRSVTPICALSRAQPHVGENVFDTKVPKTGLFTSFRRSVIANAAAVAMSRPRRTNVERTRCKATRLYARG